MKHLPERQPRNQLHASLECLNSVYSDFQQHQLDQLQQQRHNLYLAQQQNQNQHYAASYVLSTAPANTIINQSGDQDLAAAAMGNPPPQQNSVYVTGQSNVAASSYAHQSLLSRALNQVSQTPYKRLGINSNSGPAASQGPHNHLSSLHHSMRAGHSSLSLATSSFIVEEKLHNEIRKLQDELKMERDKNEALNSQLNINSSLMAAFEQSLTTLNTRLRQLTTLNEKKENEIVELREQLRLKSEVGSEQSSAPSVQHDNVTGQSNHVDTGREQDLLKQVEDLKRQLIEKDRLLTDTRLEALSAAHQLEQLESKLNGEHSFITNEDDLDEGVIVVNHSPSDSDAVTDSAHFSEIHNQISKCNKRLDSDGISFNIASGNNNDTMDHSAENNDNVDGHSTNSSDYRIEAKAMSHNSLGETNSLHLRTSSDSVSRLMGNMLLSN